MADKTHYDTLEVTPDATQEDIEAAYRFKASAYHPDRFPKDSKHWQTANDKLKNVNAAYATLKNGRSRAEYDKSLRPERKASVPPEVVKPVSPESVKPAPAAPSETTRHHSAPRPTAKRFRQSPALIWLDLLLVITVAVVLAHFVPVALHKASQEIDVNHYVAPGSHEAPRVLQASERMSPAISKQFQDQQQEQRSKGGAIWSVVLTLLLSLWYILWRLPVYERQNH